MFVDVSVIILTVICCNCYTFACTLLHPTMHIATAALLLLRLLLLRMGVVVGTGIVAITVATMQRAESIHQLSGGGRVSAP